jgi:polyisoprenoid-binding protein YceI
MEKRVLLFIAFLLFAFTVVNLKPVDGDDSVTFTIKNFGINTKGSFKGLKGSIKWDPANPTNSSFNVSVDVNTINTGIEMRDNDLKKESYFNVAKYPTITFASTVVTATNVTANLTIKGTTKQIDVPYTVTPSGNGYLFEGKFQVNRRDFGVGGGSFTLSDRVEVQLKVLATP